MPATRAFVAILAVLLLLGTSPVAAIEYAPQPFDRGVPKKFQAPLVDFLKEMGWRSNPEKIATSATSLYRSGDQIIIRFENPLLCVAPLEICLIVFGKIENKKLVSELMFFGGGKFNSADVIRPWDGIGGDGPSFAELRFFGRKINVVVFQTPSGLIAIPSPANPETLEYAFPEDKKN